MKDITIGSVVRLKSGGPLMTVVEENTNDGFVSCEWFTSTGDATSLWAGPTNRSFKLSSLELNEW